MFLDPFRLSIALLPVAAYLLLIGLVNLRRRPFLVSGGTDLAALGFALSGFAFIGPLDLLRPEPATAEFGNFIWLVLLAFFWLWLVLVVLLARPRLVVYNTSIEELHPLLAEAASRLDSEARWAGNSLSLPQLGVQLHLESFDLMRNVSLSSSGGQQNLDGWRRLARELATPLRRLRVKPNPRGLVIVALSLLLIAASVSQMLRHPIELAEAVKEVLAY
ncbi:MAG TPA: hypothetical protein VGM76_03780 [Lacipirellulaceae bacterium]